MPKHPMPTQLRVLKGDKKNRINTSEPSPADGDLPCPDDVVGEVREVWEFVVYHLKAMQIDKPLDRDQLRCYCEAVVLHREASRAIHEQGLLIQGEKGMVRNPLIGVQNQAANAIRMIGHEFGFSPSGRSGIRVGEASKPVDAGRLLTG